MRTHNGPPAAAFRPVPRSLLGRIGANADPRAMLAELTAGIEKFKADHRGDMKAMQQAYDDMQIRLAAFGVTGGGRSAVPDDPAYTKAFDSYFRTGASEGDVRAACAEGTRAKIMAAMQSGNDSAGGYLAPIEWDRKISTALRYISPLRRLCDVQTTTTRGYSTVWSDGAWGSGWVGETASRPNTATPNLTALVFQPGELYANPTITQQLLDDADFKVEEWLANELAITFALQEGIAFVSGSGTNQPAGFLLYTAGGALAAKHPGGPIPTVVTGNANAITADSLSDVVFDLGAPYRQGAAWLMSSVTANFISKLKDGQGNYLWRTSLTAGEPSTLLGYEVAIDETMPAPVAGNLPVAFGNWRLGYVINDRAGTRTLRDPYTSKPFVNFYTTKRVGGGVKDPRALRVLKVAAAA